MIPDLSKLYAVACHNHGDPFLYVFFSEIGELAAAQQQFTTLQSDQSIDWAAIVSWNTTTEATWINPNPLP